MSKYIAKKIGIYLHIPYCIKKCSYCAFNSIPSNGVSKPYLQAMDKEIDRASTLFNLKEYLVDTLYFGGGTPSLLTPGEVKGLLRRVDASYKLAEDAEMTLELNPAAQDGINIHGYRRAGINRLSIGIQSFDEKNLRFLGRLHDAKEAEFSFARAREAGFDNISIDLICGLPGQKAGDVKSDLERALKLGPEHISLYLLSIESGTPFFSAVKEGRFAPLDDEMQGEIYQCASEYLQINGYVRYETSNYAQNGFESKHNMRYWRGEDYIGVGAGAHSFISDIGWGMRCWNVKSPDKYINSIDSNLLPLEELEILTRKDAIRESVLTSLRTSTGLSEEMLNKKFAISLFEALSEGALKMLPGDIYKNEKGRIILTEKGALMADEVALSLLI
ncbi:MAG: radical SAM family heme chaperone HemW [bacterium]|nr:radical SAM family heme chaperone HemW [bacterium]